MNPTPDPKTVHAWALASSLILLALGLVLQQLYHVHHQWLAENQALQERLASLEQAANSPPAASPLHKIRAEAFSTADNSELLRLRGEVGVLRRQKNLPGGAALAEEARQLHAALASRLAGQPEPRPVATADYWPQGTWTNAGYATPEATMQSILYAALQGDFEQFADGFDETNRLHMPKPADLKKDPTEAIQLAEQTHGLKSMKVLDRQYPDANTAIFRFQIEDNQGFHEDSASFRFVGNRWYFAGHP